MDKKRKFGETQDDEAVEESSHRQLTAAHIRNQEKRLVVILERANLESVKVQCYIPWIYLEGGLGENSMSYVEPYWLA